MAQPHERLWRHPIFLGMTVGWLIGIMWWSGLMISFGPSAQVTYSGGQRIEKPITIGDRLVYGPLIAIPWSLVGLIVGAVSQWIPRRRVSIAAALGMFAGGAYSLVEQPFDGWLALTMPFYCFVGTALGLIIGVYFAALRPAPQGRAEQSPADDGRDSGS